MKTYRVLVLTDHSNHSKENSLYALTKAMAQLPDCEQLYIASRGDQQNTAFFDDKSTAKLWVHPVDESFEFRDDRLLSINGKWMERSTVDFIWLRMPPPIPKDFLTFLESEFPSKPIINHPKGIYETGSKAFLMNVPDLCAPMRICQTKADILDFSAQFPIVLKPFRDYGGRGIVKINQRKAWLGATEMSLAAFLDQLPNEPLNYLGVKYLKNVGQGDKRIVVVDGQIMGASLRLPKEGSWICNVAMGGSSNFAQADNDEIQIVNRLNPILKEMGIIMYGVDTLVNDDGTRVLSEINTTSIGGLPQIAAMEGKPLVEEAVSLIFDAFKTTVCS